MESSRTRDGDEHDKNSKGLKKTPPSGSKLKRSAEKKRSLSEDSNLTSMNIRVCSIVFASVCVCLSLCAYVCVSECECVHNIQ